MMNWQYGSGDGCPHSVSFMTSVRDHSETGWTKDSDCRLNPLEPKRGDHEGSESAWGFWRLFISYNCSIQSEWFLHGQENVGNHTRKLVRDENVQKRVQIFTNDHFSCYWLKSHLEVIWWTCWKIFKSLSPSWDPPKKSYREWETIVRRSPLYVVIPDTCSAVILELECECVLIHKAAVFTEKAAMISVEQFYLEFLEKNGSFLSCCLDL